MATPVHSPSVPKDESQAHESAIEKVEDTTGPDVHTEEEPVQHIHAKTLTLLTVRLPLKPGDLPVDAD